MNTLRLRCFHHINIDLRLENPEIIHVKNVENLSKYITEFHFIAQLSLFSASGRKKSSCKHIDNLQINSHHIDNLSAYSLILNVRSSLAPLKTQNVKYL